jgi:hypothetical protein
MEPQLISRARHQLVRDGKPVQAGAQGGQAQAEADGSAAYLEPVRERQREMAREGGGARAQVSGMGRCDVLVLALFALAWGWWGWWGC